MRLSETHMYIFGDDGLGMFSLSSPIHKVSMGIARFSVCLLRQFTIY